MDSSPSPLIEVVELRSFVRDVKSVLTEEQLTGLKTFLAGNPEAGDVVPGTNGVRKLRWRMEHRGKRGGARIIYYYRDLNMPLFLIAAFAKSEKIDLTGREKAAIRKLVDELVAEYGEQWKGMANGEAATKT